MEFRILGPLEVVEGERKLHLARCEGADAAGGPRGRGEQVRLARLARRRALGRINRRRRPSGVSRRDELPRRRDALLPWRALHAVDQGEVARGAVARSLGVGCSSGGRRPMRISPPRPRRTSGWGSGRGSRGPRHRSGTGAGIAPGEAVSGNGDDRRCAGTTAGGSVSVTNGATGCAVSPPGAGVSVMNRGEAPAVPASASRTTTATSETRTNGLRNIVLLLGDAAGLSRPRLGVDTRPLRSGKATVKAHLALRNADYVGIGW